MNDGYIQLEAPFPDDYNNIKFARLTNDIAKFDAKSKIESVRINYNYENLLVLNNKRNETIILAIHNLNKYQQWLSMITIEFGPNNQAVRQAFELIIFPITNFILEYCKALDNEYNVFNGKRQFANVENALYNLDNISLLFKAISLLLSYTNISSSFNSSWNAYATVNYKIQKLKKTSSACYIATMVYGSHEANEVIQLRAFRDKLLQGTLPGRIFIKVYYCTSPYLVKYLGRYNVFHRICKYLIERIFNLNQ
jgi:hypothetical protein